MQHEQDGDAPEAKANCEHEKSLEASLRQSEHYQNKPWNKTKSYFAKGESWIALSSLIILATYTAVTIGLWLAQLRANRINGDIYVAQSRPWIMLADVKPRSLNSDDQGGVIFWVNMSVKNVGHSPAQDVWVSGNLVIDESGSSPSQAMETTCQESRTYGYPGSPVFPDQTQKAIPNSFSIPAERVWKARNARIKSAYSFKNAKNAEALASALSAFPFYDEIYVAGCINYRSSDRRELYQTSFLFGLGSFPLLSGEPINAAPPIPGPSDPETFEVHPRRMQRIVPGDQIRIGDPLYGTFVR